MEDDVFLGVFPPQSGFQPLSGGNFISPEFVPIANSKAAHNFNKKYSDSFILMLALKISPIGIGKVMIKTPQRAQRPQESLPRKVCGCLW